MLTVSGRPVVVRPAYCWIRIGGTSSGSTNCSRNAGASASCVRAASSSSTPGYCSRSRSVTSSESSSSEGSASDSPSTGSAPTRTVDEVGVQRRRTGIRDLELHRLPGRLALDVPGVGVAEREAGARRRGTRSRARPSGGRRRRRCRRRLPPRARPLPRPRAQAPGGVAPARALGAVSLDPCGVVAERGAQRIDGADGLVGHLHLLQVRRMQRDRLEVCGLHGRELVEPDVDQTDVERMELADSSASGARGATPTAWNEIGGASTTVLPDDGSPAGELGQRCGVGRCVDERPRACGAAPRRSGPRPGGAASGSASDRSAGDQEIASPSAPSGTVRAVQARPSHHRRVPGGPSGSANQPGPDPGCPAPSPVTSAPPVTGSTRMARRARGRQGFFVGPAAPH